MNHLKLLTVIIFISFISCSKENNIINSNSNSYLDTWLVDINDIIHFDSEKDPIKSIDQPQFEPLLDSSLDDDDIILAYFYNNQVHVYPMSALEAHEIVNDSIDDNYFAITHCPLTNSSVAWNRKINGLVSSFGVSGKLYKENLIPYDRNTGSHWSQMLSSCINGVHIGQQAKTFQLVKTSFSTIKQSFPYAQVLKHESCDSSVCTGGLKSVNDEPEGTSDSEINDHETYFGVVHDGRVSLFPLSDISDSLSIEHHLIFQKKLVKVSSKKLNINLVFNANNKSFTAVNDSLPVIMKDTEGNYYNIFGVVVSGKSLGNRLETPTSYFALTFAWKDIFKSVNVIN